MELVERTMNTLIALSKKKEGMSITQLSKELGLPSSTTHRILTSLKEQNFVFQSSETKKYRLGYKVLSLGENISVENNFTKQARPVLEELAQELKQTISLCVMEDESSICLDYVEGKHTSYLMVRIGVAMPAYVTSSGKVIQAYMPINEVREYFENLELERFTENTIVDYESYAEELKKVRNDGYALSDEELQMGVQGVACPIFGATGVVIGAIAFTSLKAEGMITEENIQLVKLAADKVSELIK